MIKKVLVPLSIVAVLGVGVFSSSVFDHEKPTPTASTTVKQPDIMPVYDTHGNYKQYTTIDSMQQDADLVVVASPKKPFEQRQHVTTYMEGMNKGEKFPESIYTLTDVTVKKVLASKDTTGKKPTNLTVVEDVGIVEDNDGINKKLRFEGYEEMSQNQDYILYLKKGENGNYAILNIVNGKFDVKDQVKSDKSSSIQQEHANEHAAFDQQVKTKFKKELAEFTN